MFHTNVVMQSNTHFEFSNFILENRAVYEMACKNIVETGGQATDDNMAHARVMLDA